MRPRSDDDWLFWPTISGTGSVHDLSDQEPMPRLLGMKSVSKRAAWALNRTSRPREAPRAGFINT